MQNSKLILLLKTLSKDEIKELEKLVESPYFSRGRDCAPLLKVLKNYHPYFYSDELSPGNIYKKLFPGKEYEGSRSDSLISTLSSELYKLCKDFLIQSELNEDGFQKDYLLIGQLRKRELHKEFLKEYGKLYSSLDPENTAGMLLNKYLLNLIHAEYARSTGNTRDQVNTLLQSSENINALALIRTFLSAGSKHNARTYNIHTGPAFTDSFLDSLDSEKLLEAMRVNNDPLYPHIAAYYMAYMNSKSPGDMKYFHRLKELLENNAEKFGHSEKHVLYLVLASFLNARAQLKSDIQIKNELFIIYDKLFRMNIYMPSPKEKLDPMLYIQMLRSAFAIDRLDWAEEFIYKASEYLAEEYSEGMKKFSLAQLDMKKGEYQKALDKILHVKYVYNLQKLDLKAMQIKLHYELNNLEQALSVIDAAKHYIATTNEVTDNFKAQHLSLIRYASELIKRKANNNIKDIDLTIRKIQQEKQLLSRVWLLRKYTELKAGKTGNSFTL
jgi:hypothetical protein